MAGDGAAVKRLSAVEVEPSASHQHEFNASTLRRALGIGDQRITGRLSIAFYTDDAREPLVEETTYTLYDSRAGNPTRSAEYRLYYASSAVSRHARVGDLLVVQRGDGDALHAVIARPGTNAERDLQRALLNEERKEIRRFMIVAPSLQSYEAGAELAHSLLTPGTDVARRDDLARVVSRDDALQLASARGAVPSTREMAEAAHRITHAAFGPRLGSDEFLHRALEAETALYNAIEEELASRHLREMQERGTLTFQEVMKFSMRYFQSRKARRGTSLQNHFAKLLDDASIPYTAQCVTENRERPDFVMPSCDAYHDAEFAASRLRMVACKSRTRERWDEVLNEAARIKTKFLLSIDEDITDAVVENMERSNVRLFLPQAVIDANYAGRPSVPSIGNVRRLIEDLRAATS